MSASLSLWQRNPLNIPGKAFLQFLAPGCGFCLGNLPAVTGRVSIRTVVAGLFDLLQSIYTPLPGAGTQPTAASATARSATPGTTARNSRSPLRTS
jgi:hypothetical protein